MGNSPDFWVGSISLVVQFLQMFGQVARKSAETVRFERNILAGGLNWISVFCVA